MQLKTITKLSETSGLVKPRFGPGMLLQHEDLEQITNYSTNVYRMVFRSLVGSGILCGLNVSIADEQKLVSVTVTEGMALDCEGYLVQVRSDQTLKLNECNDPPTTDLLVVLRRKTKVCATRYVVCNDGDDDTSIPSREIEGFEIQLIQSPPQAELEKALAEADKAFREGKCSCEAVAGVEGVLLARLTRSQDKGEEQSTNGQGGSEVTPAAPPGDAGGANPAATPSGQNGNNGQSSNAAQEKWISDVSVRRELRKLFVGTDSKPKA